MTTKEIAESVGKPERTVRDWVKSLAAKSAVIEAKLAASSPMKPADYNLAETCQIIEEGLGKAAADVYRTNAANAELAKQPKQVGLPAGAQMMALQKIYGAEEARKRIDFAMGYVPQTAKEKPLMIAGKPISKQAYAVEMKNREKEQAKVEARGLKTLFDN